VGRGWGSESETGVGGFAHLARRMP
jgi:hypothetical protein